MQRWRRDKKHKCKERACSYKIYMSRYWENQTTPGNSCNSAHHSEKKRPGADWIRADWEEEVKKMRVQTNKLIAENIYLKIVLSARGGNLQDPSNKLPTTSFILF